MLVLTPTTLYHTHTRGTRCSLAVGGVSLDRESSYLTGRNVLLFY